MFGHIKAIIILLFCVAAAAFVIRVIDRNKNMIPHVLAWGLLITVIFMTQSYLLIMLILVLVKLLYLKNDEVKNISMFLSLFVVLPFSVRFQLIPEVNLVDVSIVHMLSLVFFVPLALRIIRSEEFSFHRLDFAVFGFMLILLIGNFRETSVYLFTWFQVFRESFDMLLVMVLPYFVISRGLRNMEALDVALAGLLFGGLTMAFFAVFEAALVWRPYVEIGNIVGTMPGIESMYEIRGRFLRVTGSLTGPITFGFYLTIVLATLLYYMRKMRMPLVLIMAGIGFILLVLFMTGSRAALLGGLLFTLLYFLNSLDRSARRVLIVPLVLVAFAGVFLTESTQRGSDTPELEDVDQYGTFEYRKRLFTTALQVIPDNLLIGTREYRNDDRMKTLTQGQNIIDMVNGFIHITIEYGLIALLLLLFILIRSYRALSSPQLLELDPLEESDDEPFDEPAAEIEAVEMSEFDFDDDDELDIEPQAPAVIQRWRLYFGQAFAALLISLCLQFSFTSYSSTIIPLLWISLGLMRAFQLGLIQRDLDEDEDETDFVPV